MTKENAKRWAEIFTAYAEGKTIQIKHYIHCDEGDEWEWEDVDGDDIDSQRCLSDYRIKPTPKTRRMTYQELADWLRDCPQEHREWKYRHDNFANCRYGYFENAANDAVDDIVIRRNHGEWEEPLIVVEEE